MVTRAVDQGKLIWDFAKEMFLECPRCSSPAVSRIPDNATHQEAPKNIWATRRITCTQCSYTNTWSGNSTFTATSSSPVKDGYFNLPLLLQTPCAGDILWAYNLEHLEALEAWVAADLRQRKQSPAAGWLNKSYFSRLPKWIKLAKHRTAVLTAIEKLKTKATAVAHHR